MPDFSTYKPTSEGFDYEGKINAALDELDTRFNVAAAFGGTVAVAGVATFDDGAVGAPSVNLGSATTGFYAPAANQIGVAVSGVQKGLWTSTGLNNTPLGATTPSTVGASNITLTGTITSTRGNDAQLFNSASATTGFQYMSIQNTSGVALFGLNGSTNAIGGTGASAYDAVLRGASGIAFSANNGTTAHMRLSSAGALNVTGTFAAGGNVNGSTVAAQRAASATAFLGPTLSVTNVAADRTWALQLNTSNALDFWGYDGSTTKSMSLTPAGALTVTSTITGAAATSMILGTTHKWHAFNDGSAAYWSDTASGGGQGFYTTSTLAGLLVGGATTFSTSSTVAAVTGQLTVDRSANTAAAAFTVKNSAATATNQYGAQYWLPGDPNDATRYYLDCIAGAGGGTQRATIRSNGGLANFQANDANLSDAFYKPVVESLRAIGMVPALWDAHKGMDFCRFKYGDQTHDDFNFGYTAQDVRKNFRGVAPEIVGLWDERDPWMVGGALAVYSEDLHNIGHVVIQQCQLEIEAIKRHLDLH